MKHWVWFFGRVKWIISITLTVYLDLSLSLFPALSHYIPSLSFSILLYPAIFLLYPALSRSISLYPALSIPIPLYPTLTTSSLLDITFKKMMPTWKWLKYGNLWAKFDEEKKGESKDETTNELQNISMDFQLKLTAAILRSFDMCTIWICNCLTIIHYTHTCIYN